MALQPLRLYEGLLQSLISLPRRLYSLRLHTLRSGRRPTSPQCVSTAIQIPSVARARAGTDREASSATWRAQRCLGLPHFFSLPWATSTAQPPRSRAPNALSPICGSWPRASTSRLLDDPLAITRPDCHELPVLVASRRGTRQNFD